MTIFMLKLKMQENIFIKLLLDVGRWTLYIPMGLVFSFQFSVFSFLPFYFFTAQTGSPSPVAPSGVPALHVPHR